MAKKIKVGDKVKFKAEFLRNIGWYTDVPRSGVVIKETRFAKDRYLFQVEWESEFEGPTNVLDSNLMLFKQVG